MTKENLKNWINTRHDIAIEIEKEDEKLFARNEE